ncbi:DUF302 domain-containing protein [Roseobacter denitrificans]|uniref:DUF302 domain-containing protein n=2 Tax=Roseobacter denitrificans TaxID=2434 RepID=Q16DY9_ROSDO|nr:DUF302 domain-containing protein [Roseobacter denitrificans]ABG29804.1 hypothetical protein RD1_0068 [Roseobacter denitrificans OCh 114]SFG26735.1 Uncharacterized conserved protein, DUF302 family [Roseobacter denitrificans OCh 114]
MHRFLTRALAWMFALTAMIAMAARADQAEVDELFTSVQAAVAAQGLNPVIEIDHARLAAAEGVEMPASRVQLFSDSAINASLMLENIRAGLDLPFRVLAFDQNGSTSLTYTSSAFLSQRHGLTDARALAAFDARLNDLVAHSERARVAPVPTLDVGPDFGIVELRSRYDVPETVARLKAAVTAQPDTIWFGEIDFQVEAAQLGISLVASRLLLFGGPAPGGVAMAEYPAIGLDAFCQKVFVYAGDDGNAVVIYNDIAALAKLHYGTSIDPHRMLNKRLRATFTPATE